MHPNTNMSKVIGGKRYSVATATLLASNEVWDGHNFDRNGRNTFLYRTRGGAYFAVYLSRWDGERDTIDPLAQDAAMALYEQLPKHIVEYEQAFDAVVDEAAAGRPTYYGKPMRQTAVWLPEEMLIWLKGQPGSMSDTIRELVKQAMQS